MNTQEYKFGIVQNELDQNPKQFFYSNIWNTEKSPQFERLVIAPESNQIDLIIDLSKRLPEPFGILYI